MKNTKITEHTQKLRIKTSAQWQKKKHEEGAYSFKVMITDKEIAEKAKSIPNKAEFLREAIKKLLNNEKMA